MIVELFISRVCWGLFEGWNHPFLKLYIVHEYLSAILNNVILCIRNLPRWIHCPQGLTFFGKMGPTPCCWVVCAACKSVAEVDDIKIW
jgi:hypothetical protein